MPPEFNDRRGLQFFHGSDAVLKEGDFVLPSSRTGIRNFSHVVPERANSVYLTDHHADAVHYGAHVYEVEPQGVVQRDPLESGAYMAPYAKVKKRVGKGLSERERYG